MTIPHKPFGELSDAEKGALLLAHHEGKRIEYFIRVSAGDKWVTTTGPIWHDREVYRIAPEPKTPDTINWEHVAPEYNFMARDIDGLVSLSRTRPAIVSRYGWGSLDGAGPIQDAKAFASYRRGTVEWQDSLVIRPGYEDRS